MPAFSPPLVALKSLRKRQMIGWLVVRSVGLSVGINHCRCLWRHFCEPTRLPAGVGVQANVTWRVGPRLVVFTVYRGMIHSVVTLR